jgi:formate hydrogenlyase subunit 4
MIDTAIHLALLLLFPPLLLGVIGKTKAWFGGRRGPRLLQPYYDIAKLLRKGLVLSRTTTWIFWAGPPATLAATLFAGLLMPLGPFAAPLGFTGDFLLFAYLFGLARFFTTAAALDTGSAFEGMGSAREVTFAVLAEPALFFAFLAFARASGSLDLNGMLLGFADRGFSVGAAAPFVLIGIGLFIVLLAETCRLPIDDPATHLELTMIHEAMVLDHSGPLFGIIQYAAAVKLFTLGSLLLHVVVPFALGPAWFDRAVFVAASLALAVAVGVLESVTARLRMRRVPYLLVSALLLCGSGLVLLVR